MSWQDKQYSGINFDIIASEAAQPVDVVKAKFNGKAIDFILKKSQISNDIAFNHALQKQLAVRPLVQDEKPYEIKQDLSNFTVLPTFQDDSILMKDEKDVPEPELLKEQPKKTSLGKKLAGLGLLALTAVGAYAARKTGAKIPLPGSNQLMEAPQNPINSGLIEYGSLYRMNEWINEPDTGFCPAPQQTGLADLHPDEKSRDGDGVGAVLNPSYNRGEAYRITLDMSDKQALKTMYTGYDASRNLFKPEEFRNFASDKFYGNREFYGKCFFLDKYGYPEQDKDGNIIPRAGINLKELADNLDKDGLSESGIGAVFAHISGIKDVFKEIKPEDYKKWMGSEAFKALAKEYGIKEGVPWWVFATVAGVGISAVGGLSKVVYDNTKRKLE